MGRGTETPDMLAVQRHQMQEASAFSTSVNFLLFFHPTRDFLESGTVSLNAVSRRCHIVFKRNARMFGNLV